MRERLPTPQEGEGGIEVRAPAKINLTLRVLAQEVTRYHQIETIFSTIELADSLRVRRGGSGIELEIEGPDLGPREENLVYRSAQAFFAEAGLEPQVRIDLEKRIPAGAGLGGGSSDAAATLQALNTLYDHPLTPARLREVGARLGSDISFFMAGTPQVIAWGRGERMVTLPALPQVPLLLVLPRIMVSTGEAYQALAKEREGEGWATEPSVIEWSRLNSWTGIATIAENDFEGPIFRRYPELDRVRRTLEEGGAMIARMTGSGSAIYGIFPDRPIETELREEIGRILPDATVITTQTGGTG